PTPRNDVSSCHSYPAIDPCVRFHAVRKAPANEATPTIRRVRWEPLPTRRQPRGGRFGTSPVRRFGRRCALPPRADRLTSRARLHVAEETPEELRSLRVGASTAGDAHPLTRRPRFQLRTIRYDPFVLPPHKRVAWPRTSRSTIAQAASNDPARHAASHVNGEYF